MYCSKFVGLNPLIDQSTYYFTICRRKSAHRSISAAIVKTILIVESIRQNRFARWRGLDFFLQSITARSPPLSGQFAFTVDSLSHFLSARICC